MNGWMSKMEKWMNGWMIGFEEVVVEELSCDVVARVKGVVARVR